MLAAFREPAHPSQVADEFAISLLPGAPVRHAQQRRWVTRDEAGASMEIRRPSEARDGERFSGESQDRCRAERDHDPWMHESQLLLQPPSVVLDLACRRLLVDAALSALLELEVLDGIGDVDPMSIDPGIRHRPIEQLARRSHERPALPILLVTRLLADERDRGADGPLAQNRARRARHQRFCCGDDMVEGLKAFRLDVSC